jgi:hypothetical protein
MITHRGIVLLPNMVTVIYFTSFLLDFAFPFPFFAEFASLILTSPSFLSVRPIDHSIGRLRNQEKVVNRPPLFGKFVEPCSLGIGPRMMPVLG